MTGADFKEFLDSGIVKAEVIAWMAPGGTYQYELVLTNTRNRRERFSENDALLDGLEWFPKPACGLLVGYEGMK